MRKPQEWLTTALADQPVRQRAREAARKRKAALYAPLAYPRVVEALQAGDHVQLTSAALPWIPRGQQYTGVIWLAYRHPDGTAMVEVLRDGEVVRERWSASCWRRRI